MAPDISSTLVEQITCFLDERGSTEQILFWLRQDAAFRDPILQAWHELITGLGETDRQLLETLGTQMLPMIGLGGGVPKRDRAWLAEDLNHEDRIPPNYVLYGLLMVTGLAHSDDRGKQALFTALLGNPSTPEQLRTQLWQQVSKDPPYGGLAHLKFLQQALALALNPAVPEAERLELMQRVLASGYTEGVKAIATHPDTPQSILEQITTGDIGRKQQVSRNPNAPEHVFRELVTHENSTTRRYIAENPNAPTDILFQLASDSDPSVREKALQNPSLTSLQRYHVLLQQDEVAETRKANELLARRVDSPYALAQVVEKGDRQAKITAARSPKTPLTVLEQLATDADETVRSVVLQNRNLPLNIQLLMTHDPSVNIRCALVRQQTHQDTPVALLEQLANDESEKVRAFVAANPGTPADVLIQLADDSDRSVKSGLVKNPNTPETVLNRLGIEEGIYDVRNPNTPAAVWAHVVTALQQGKGRSYNADKTLAKILKHPVKRSKMPSDTLSELAGHKNSSVRYRVAQHPNTPVSALEQLAKDDYVPTLRAVVDHPRTPVHVLEQLALNSDLTIRLSVVRHPRIPASVLLQIVQSSQAAGNVANRTVDTLKSAFPGNQYDLLREIAKKPQTPLEALEILARRDFATPPPEPNSILPPRSGDDVVRSLAFNPNLTPTLLGILTQDSCVDVRLALIRHPNLTPELWQQLAEDSDPSVQQAIAASQQAPTSVLEHLGSAQALEVRAALAANPQTPTDGLNQLAQDDVIAVRCAIAANPSTPLTTLEHLAQDQKVEVRRAVTQNFNTPASTRDSLQNLVTRSASPQLSPTLRGLSRLYNPQTDDLSELLTEYAQSDNAFVRFVTFLHPLAPPEVLQRGAQSPYWLERYAVAENSATSPSIRQQFAQDSNRIIRAVAMTHGSV